MYDSCVYYCKNILLHVQLYMSMYIVYSLEDVKGPLNACLLKWKVTLGLFSVWLYCSM
jgi:hypothetical protein